LKIFIPDEFNDRYKISTTGLNHITHPQSSQVSGRRISTDASWLKQGGGGGTGLTNRL